jgi:Tol biopolymer transport system component
MLYTVTTPDWKEADSHTDIHLVSLREGVSSNRQMTFTGGHNESSPTWGPDGSFFLFASNRDASDGNRGSQLYLMRPDGGEARKITDASDGVSGFEFSPDGRWLVYRSGPSSQQQLFRLPVEGIVDPDSSPEGEKLTDGEAGIEQWE